ncbi:hypothetical protein G6720_06045 [Polynucleobacter paneuropaeus]|nr:hypothetical protein G6720_06045 [Polynucleobacter paneuropaeus]
MNKTVLQLFLISSLVLSYSVQAEEPNPSGGCFSALETNPELQTINNKVSLSGASGQTLEMLSNDKKPTPIERVALAKWDAYRQPCIKIDQEWSQANLPANINVIRERLTNSFKALLADLYSGKISYGQFAKTRQLNADTAKRDAVNVNEQNKSAIALEQQRQQQLNQQAAQAEAQQRSQNNALATQMILNNKPYQAPTPYQAPAPYQMPPLQAPTPIRAPTNTNCRMVGNVMNCTSY